MCSSIAGRYALAIFKAAVQRGAVTEIVDEVRVISKILEKGQPFRIVLIRRLQKRIKPRWIGDFWKFVGISDSTLRFLSLVARNRRVDLLPDIVRLLGRLTNDYLGQEDIYVYTASEIAAEDKQKIYEKLSTIFRKKLNITFEIRATILGGFIAQTDSVTIDVSVSHQIERFAEAARSYIET
ncbi:MAG: ATP synthase F1 subunit delta [Holosporales bacterium]|nr:ATP synthase F1 subunit delta [Holosporales bacterium]